MRGLTFSLPIWLMLTGGCSFSAQAANMLKFTQDNWVAYYPVDWKYVSQKAADGSVLHMFVAPQAPASISYCHVTQKAVDEKLSPRISRMNKNQVRDFLLSNSDWSNFGLIYESVTTAPAFKPLRIAPGILGKDQPATIGDFSFSSASGFHYRARSYYTFWNKWQISVWCQAAGRRLDAAEQGYGLSLAAFQNFFANFEVNK